MTRQLRQELKLISDSSFAFSADTVQQEEFGLADSLIKRLWCRLKGTWTPSAVTVPGTIHADGILRLVPKIVVKIDGKEVKSGSLASFARLAELYDQTDGVRLDIYTGAAIAQDFDIAVPILFEAAGSVSTIDSLLDGRVSRKLSVEVTWADADDVVVGETSTLTLTSTLLELYYEATEPFDLTAPLWQFREEEQPFQNIVTADAADFPLTYEQGTIMRALQIRCEDNGDMSDDMIDKIALLINGTKEIPLSELKSEFVESYQRFNFGVTRTAKGYYHLELCERTNDGSLVIGTGLGAHGTGDQVNSIALRLKTVAPVGTGSITVHKAIMVPPELQAA